MSQTLRDQILCEFPRELEIAKSETQVRMSEINTMSDERSETLSENLSDMSGEKSETLVRYTKQLHTLTVRKKEEHQDDYHSNRLVKLRITTSPLSTYL